ISPDPLVSGQIVTFNASGILSNNITNGTIQVSFYNQNASDSFYESNETFIPETLAHTSFTVNTTFTTPDIPTNYTILAFIDSVIERNDSIFLFDIACAQANVGF
ncbi:20736_t:CDS:1, partial [Gigaspora margarita]